MIPCLFAAFALAFAPAERRDQIILDERCLLKGWTPLHYAAAEGSASGVSTLLAAGASVNVHGAGLSGMSSNGGAGLSGADGAEGAGTALELTKAIMYKEGAGPRREGLEEVARQLSAAIDASERAKEQRERKEREAKVGAACGWMGGGVGLGGYESSSV